MVTTEQAVGSEPGDGPRSGRRGWTRIVLAAAAVVVVLTGAALLVTQLRGGDEANPVEHSGPYPGTPNGRKATPGWRLVASLGLEIEVPAGWATNDTRCGSAISPTVVRAQGAISLCGSVESPDVPVAELLATPFGDPGQTPEGYARQSITIDRVPAVRADGHLADGRAETILTFASRSARLDVRGATPEVTEHILASVQVVTVDSLGCDSGRPSTPRPPAPTGLTTLVPAAVSEVDVCYYGEPDYYTPGRKTYAADALQGSVALTGAAAQELASALNAGMPGRNPDSRSCLGTREPIRPDTVLLFRSADRPVLPVYLTSSGCWERGFDNGSRAVMVTAPLVALVLNPLHTGYGLTGDIPGLPDDANSTTPKPAEPPAPDEPTTT